jgi:hypothetical protein
VVPVNSRFLWSDPWRTVWRTLPYILDHAVRKPFRSTPHGVAAIAAVSNPEFHRVVHDLYCDMFLRGYRQSTGYRIDRSTGLALVLFAIFIYAFDDEFEDRRRYGNNTDVEPVINSPCVAEIWQTIGAYLRATGHSDEIREHILTDFFGMGFDEYRRDIREAAVSGGFATTLRLVEFDSGRALRTMYHLIRLFNRQPYHKECAEEFYNLGMAGKFLDDMADYTDDVRSANPNLLHALATEEPADLVAAQSSLEAGEPITMRWWSEHCPVTYERYLRRTFGYYDQVTSPALRLPLDVYLALLRSRRFWRISTVRTSRRQP